MILSIFFIIVAYLMGSVCSAVIVCKMSSLPDPRLEGSKNPGASNVLRLAGEKYAVLVLIADLLKGTIPVLFAKMFLADPLSLGFVALAAVIGHMYPIFFGFKGGKGVATAIGSLLGLQFIVGIMVAGTWLLVARFTRYSSLASLISVSLSPFYATMIIGRIEIVTPLFFMALLVILKHKSNIGRLIDKTEPKIKLRQGNILGEVLDEQPSVTTPLNNKKTVVEVNTVEIITVAKKTKTAKTKKAPAAKEKPAKKPAVKKSAPAKKPATTKAKATKPKERK